MRGRLHHVILDCPDPARLARFYSALLNRPITYDCDDFMVVAANNTTSGLASQLAPDHRAPTWPDTTVPQQMHLEIMVENVPDATPHVVRLGATKLRGEGAATAVRDPPPNSLAQGVALNWLPGWGQLTPLDAAARAGASLNALRPAEVATPFATPL